jgi:hypothetical protein
VSKLLSGRANQMGRHISAHTTGLNRVEFFVTGATPRVF